MKKLICLFAISTALILPSCSSSNDDSANPSVPVTENDILIKKIIETYANDGSVITTDFVYNGKKLVSAADSDGYHEEYTYTGDLITTIKYYDDTNTLVLDEVFTYGSDNQISLYLSKDYVTNHGRKETFVYNSNGTVTFSVYTGDNTTQTTLSQTGTSYTTNGEVTQMDYSFSSGVVYTASRTYTYDTKNSPFKNITGYEKLNIINEEAFGISHNILTDHYVSSLSTDELTTTTFTYNGLNFPLTGSEIVGTNAASGITSQYFYNN